jgi:hypothetical protein
MLCCILLFLCLHPAMAQSDTTAKPLPKAPAPVHSPKKAAMLSAILPGAGQFYNHKYWKIPVIYAAGAGLGWFLVYEQQNVDFATYNYQQSVNKNYSKLAPYYQIRGSSSDEILSDKNYYTHYRDLAFIGCVMLYTLNVLDATVDAHLWHFDQRINDDLSLRFSPAVQPVVGSTLPAPAFRLTFCLK